MYIKYVCVLTINYYKMARFVIFKPKPRKYMASLLIFLLSKHLLCTRPGDANNIFLKFNEFIGVTS